ncbi:hypothetical protein PybrP1_009963 [[Pythium] brassicae (nom. inval.)]|nr:hypothetical protein PybrP1_009963 [[Pythium] brassicae (nom. inval.)]
MTRFFRSHHDTPQNSKRKMINKYVADRSSIKAAALNAPTATHHRAQPSGIRCTLSAAMEAKLVKWVNDLRRDGVPVSAEMLRLEACETAQEGGIGIEQFGASWQWRRRFMKQHAFSVRAKTHQGQEAPRDVIERARKFTKEVARVVEVDGVTSILNADQTAVNFELLPRTTPAEHRAATPATPFVMQPPTREEVTSWLCRSWEETSAHTITAGFVLCGLLQKRREAEESDADTAELQASVNALLDDLEVLSLVGREILTDEDDCVDVGR